MFIYLLQQGAFGPIKIGKTANLKARFSSIKSGNPTDIFLRLLLRGDHATERGLHQRFAALRIAGEWFQPGLELLAFIKKPDGFELAPTPAGLTDKRGVLIRTRPKTTKSKSLRVHCTHGQKALLREAAARAGMDVSAWMLAISMREAENPDR